jgi:hypothetical protein
VVEWRAVGIAGVFVLAAIAYVLPHAIGWDVHDANAPLASAGWHPRVGPGTLPAVVLGAFAALRAPQLAATLPWRRLLMIAYAAGVGWLVSLATIDGLAGIGGILGRDDEYLQTARHVTSISATLHNFIAHIPLTSADNWPTHVAGHPPGALLFFVLLVRVGLGGGLAAGSVVIAVAATVPLAVLATLRRLGAEREARLAAPVLVFGPAATWMAVSADAVFAAAAAWCLCALAFAATSATPFGVRPAWRTGGFGVLSGVLFGYCVLLSYGLPLLAVLGGGVLLAARTIRPVVWVVAGAAAVVLAFAAVGFAWWDAYPVLRTRYYAGAGSTRPAAYWVWGDLAALCVSAGPVLGASLVEVGRRARRAMGASTRVVTVLVGAAVLIILLADLSFMSKAEVERIWLPFVPWLLLSVALLPPRWRRCGLVAQIALALVLQTLVRTRW